MKDFLISYSLTELLTQKTLRSTYLAYSAQDPQQKVIVKVFERECAGQNQKESLFHANALLSLCHPHIVPILDVAINEQGNPYVVSEHRPRSLRQHLNSLPSGNMDWREAIDITMQVGEALSYSHAQHVIHGNMKPENIFYDEVGRVQLTDFSLAPFVDITRLDYKSDPSTLRYLAPEQFMGKVDQQSDQYALACLAYELISGHAPFEAPNFSALWKKHATEFAPSLSAYVLRLPLPIDLAILKALAKKPEERFPDINAFLASLTSRLTSQVSGLFLSLLSSDPTNITSPLPAITSEPFFSELANRTLQSGPRANSLSGQVSDIQPRLQENRNPSSSQSWERHPQENRNPSSSQSWERHPRLESPGQITRNLAITTSNSAPLTLDTGKSAKMPSMHEQKTEELLISDEQIIAEVSAVAKRRRRRRNYFVWISVLVVACILLGLLLPYFSHASPGTTTPIGSITPESTPVQNGQSIITTPTVTAAHTPTAPVTVAHTTASVHNPQSQPVLPPEAVPTLPTASGTQSPVQQPTSPVTSHPPQITPTQPVPTATAVSHGIGSVQIAAGGSGAGSFVADEYFTNPSSGRPSGTSHVSSQTIDTSGVSNPAPESVYQSARIGDCLYTIPNLTPQAYYTVRLHFAEMYWALAGKRTFNVLLNNQLVLSNFDIFALAGGQDKAIVEEFVVPANSDGTITIQFATIHNNAQINAIEVLAV